MNKLLCTILCIINLNFLLAQTDSTANKTISYKNFITPISLVGLGIYSRYNVPLGSHKIREFRNENYSNFHTDADDYIQFLPIGVAYGLGIFPKMKSKNDFVNKSALLFKSELLMAGLVYSLKYSIKDRRPDTGANNSWPSGHTAQAFVAASFLDHEYRYKSIWISIAAYSCASTVGVLRVLNDRHWSADVLAGAGIGILSTNIVYLTHQYKWKNFKFLSNNNISILPYYQNRGGGVIISASL